MHHIVLLAWLVYGQDAILLLSLPDASSVAICITVHVLSRLFELPLCTHTRKLSQ